MKPFLSRSLKKMIYELAQSHLFQFCLGSSKKTVFEATGRLNREEQTYKLEDEDLWVNASAEHTISPMYMNEILTEGELPIRYVGYTTAFRKRLGLTARIPKDFRLHQFNKLEMESFTTAEDSLHEHLFMVAIQEYLMQQLDLPYHALEKLCTADIGRPNAKGVDIEAWLQPTNL